MQSKDGDSDSEGSASDNSLMKGLKSQHREENSLPLPDNEDSICWGVSGSPSYSVRSTAASPRSSRSSRQRQLARHTTLSPEEHRTSICYTKRPTPLHPTSVPSEAHTLLAKFKEWPLQGVVLKQITEGDRTTFQLQFE